ncbi:MAG: PLD nuclease N-terminal domain-containing protein [Euryarchaeota archaeon]|nr:PLD nuclease N-terminal domain-containing protein [Euryarchaeota archaeon]
MGQAADTLLFKNRTNIPPQMELFASAIGTLVIDPILLRFHTGPIAIVALLIIILQVLTIISIVRGRLSLLAKVLWILAVIFIPILGIPLYFFLGRTRR